MVVGSCEITSESVFFLRHKDVGHRSPKASQIITEPPSLKEVCVLVMFCCLSPLEGHCVSALIWLGQKLPLETTSQWTEIKKTMFCRVCVCMAMFRLFLVHYLTLVLISFVSAYRTPSGKTPPGLYFLRRKQMWRRLSWFKSFQNLTRIK